MANSGSKDPKVAALKAQGYGGPGTPGYKTGDGVIGFDGKLRPSAGSNFSNKSSLSSPLGGGSTKMGG